MQHIEIHRRAPERHCCDGLCTQQGRHACPAMRSVQEQARREDRFEQAQMWADVRRIVTLIAVAAVLLGLLMRAAGPGVDWLLRLLGVM